MEPAVHGDLTMKLVVVDLGTSNMRSLSSALAFLGVPHFITTDPQDVASASHVILPGVGAFDAAMKRMRELSLFDALRQHAERKPLLGVCLGMQLMFDSSEEGCLPGLGIIQGCFRRLRPPPQAPDKVPHVGFSLVRDYSPSGFFEGLRSQAYFYFTHSYAVMSIEVAGNIGMCDYAQPFVAAFQCANVCGAQFHPEKSQSNGLRMLSNFVELS
jgi:glutamine amidotransferase